MKAAAGLAERLVGRGGSDLLKEYAEVKSVLPLEVVLVYLLLLFARNKLSKENRMLVGLIPNNIAPALMTKVIPMASSREYSSRRR